MALIELEQLCRDYRVQEKKAGTLAGLRNLVAPRHKTIQAVRDLSFTIDSGEMVGFIGPNGAGKSTTIKILTGILVPSSGQVRVAGFDPCRDRKRYVKQIGAVFGQRTQLWWDLPLTDTFGLLRKIYDIPSAVYQDNLATFNRILDLKSFQDRPVRQLSLGQRMRADIAAALLHNPGIVFFDEPTIGLDVLAKEEIRQFITHMNRQRGVTMLFTTHDLADIEKTCQRAIIIDQGSTIYDGSLERIKADLGGGRTLVVECREAPPAFSHAGVTMEAVNPLKHRLSFQRDQVDMGELMKRLSSEWDIADLGIEESDIESIVRGIYRSSLTAKTAQAGD